MKRPDLHMKSVIWTLGALAAAGLVGAVAVVGLGLYNTSARDGHWPGVSAVLHTTFQNSVALRAVPESEVPELTDEMAALGARHYASACATCHSAPGRVRSATLRQMSPVPPHIEVAVRPWTAAEFQWILYEGVKMSGMPAWPAERPEEVWPVVAFLERVQSGMTGAEYDALIRMDRPVGEDMDYCAACHGAKGDTDNPHIPRLDILSERYMAGALDAYRRGTRESGVMSHAAAEVPAGALPELARRFAEFAPEGAAREVEGDAARGRALAMAEAGTRVPSCAACHGPWPAPIDEKFPALAGQNVAYLETQLHLWRAESRGGSGVSELMHESARDLTDADIEALAAYYAGLAPATLNATAE